MVDRQNDIPLTGKEVSIDIHAALRLLETAQRAPNKKTFTP